FSEHRYEPPGAKKEFLCMRHTAQLAVQLNKQPAQSLRRALVPQGPLHCHPGEVTSSSPNEQLEDSEE
ncbi:hypothetical protein P7K49_002840, partial [Saguinus oedipus]